MNNVEALQMIAEQKKIKNVIEAITSCREYSLEPVRGQNMNIMREIAFDNSIDSFVMCDNLDPLYQIAIQMKIENVINAASYILSQSLDPQDEDECYKSLESIINSYSKENEKNKLM